MTGKGRTPTDVEEAVARFMANFEVQSFEVRQRGELKIDRLLPLPATCLLLTGLLTAHGAAAESAGLVAAGVLGMIAVPASCLYLLLRRGRRVRVTLLRSGTDPRSSQLPSHCLQVEGVEGVLVVEPEGGLAQVPGARLRRHLGKCRTRAEARRAAQVRDEARRVREEAKQVDANRQASTRSARIAADILDDLREQAEPMSTAKESGRLSKAPAAPDGRLSKPKTNG